jgi:predicted  nucleic acid-binding Zn ribbon protein
MNLDDARTCKTCGSGDDVKLMQPVRDGLMFKCVTCKRVWTIIFARESRPMFPPRPEA